ncbi:MAG: peptide-methionine (S)-S-oxide reductase [Dyadobacter sp.]
MDKIGFGGNCYWCSEAIFQSLKGISLVMSGWITSEGEYSMPSEGVIVEFDPTIIPLEALVAIHLYTHSCTADHNLRVKYRSAIYTYTEGQDAIAQRAIEKLQMEYENPIITGVIPCKRFIANKESFQNYYYSNPEKPFCKNIINPKLKRLRMQFLREVDADRLKHLNISEFDEK